MARAKSEKNRVKTMTFRILEEASCSDTLLRLSNEQCVAPGERRRGFEPYVSELKFEALTTTPLHLQSI